VEGKLDSLLTELQAKTEPADGQVVTGGAGQIADVKVTLDSETVDVSDRAARDNGKIDIASLDQYTPVSGRLPVDGSGVTQPVSATDLDIRNLVAAQDTVVVTGGASQTADVKVTLDSESVSVTGPLTDTQLRATAVPISGALTDTQLRATPVPVSGSFSAASAILKKTVALTGSGTVHTTTVGKVLRVFSVKFSVSADMTDVAFKFASGSAFEKYLVPKAGGLYGANNHPDYVAGGTAEALNCDITGTGTVQINIDYLEI
jgi:hypothetical protein